MEAYYGILKTTKVRLNRMEILDVIIIIVTFNGLILQK